MIDADGAAVMVTFTEVEKLPHVAVAATVYVIEYVPATLVDGVITPVVAFKLRPAGLAENVPPVVPMVTGPSEPMVDLQ